MIPVNSNKYLNKQNIYTMATNEIGLKVKDSKVLSAKLNKLLANYEIYYQNLRNLDRKSVV